MEVVARHWMQQDEPAVRAWIDRSSLPNENKKRLLDQPR
jgi:hypothetical protein